MEKVASEDPGMSKIPNPGDQRLEAVDCLRGIAVLSVCFSHFMDANNGISHESLLWKMGTHGWLGVEIFFVISGFIIPYALHRSGFRLSDYPRFLIKRMVRLDPPYLVAIGVAIVMGLLATWAPGYRGAPFHCSLPQVLLHFAFLNTFFGYEWVNDAFWSLAIEFQYYLAVGLLFPLLAHRSSWVRAVLFAVLGGLALAFPNARFVFHWFFLFILGMLAFQWHAGLWTRLELMSGLFLGTVGVNFTHGWMIASVCLATALVIAFVRFSSRILLFFGSISYSLYLLHGPIGLKVVNVIGRHVSGTWGGLGAISLGLLVSTFCSVILFRFVERPARRWSSLIKYRRDGA